MSKTHITMTKAVTVAAATALAAAALAFTTDFLLLYCYQTFISTLPLLQQIAETFHTTNTLVSILVLQSLPAILLVTLLVSGIKESADVETKSNKNTVGLLNKEDALRITIERRESVKEQVKYYEFLEFLASPEMTMSPLPQEESVGALDETADDVSSLADSEKSQANRSM